MTDADRARYAEIRARSRAECERSRRLRGVSTTLCHDPPYDPRTRIERLMAFIESVYGPHTT